MQSKIKQLKFKAGLPLENIYSSQRKMKKGDHKLITLFHYRHQNNL